MTPQNKPYSAEDLIRAQRMDVGAVLRRARRGKKLTQKQLAELIGCNRITINRIENGHSELTLLQAEKAADALGITLETLTSLKTNQK